MRRTPPPHGHPLRQMDPPFMVETLVRDRFTAGARWRITQELAL